MEIRPATASDAPDLSAVQIASWRGAYAHIFPADFLEGLVVPESRWTAKLAGGVRILVAVDSGTVVGYCSFSDGEGVGWAELRAIYVRPGSQHRGHGLRLLHHAESALSDEGFHSVYLWVFDRNAAARRFYERLGWILAKPFRIEEIGTTQVTLVRYEKDLRSIAGPPRGLPDM